MSEGNLLIVDDNKNVLKALRLFLQYEFNIVKCISNPNQIPYELGKLDYDVVLLDMNFSSGINTGNEGFFWFNEIKKHSPTTEVVMFTAYGDVELAVKAVKEGAVDFILKPWDNDKMIATLKAALHLKQARTKANSLEKKQSDLKKEINKENKLIIGSSPAMLKLVQMISKIASTDANILITGENGTGKEVIAREIHRQSLRNDEIMVTVDMGAIPETLFESELFGHKKGAFTDAFENKTGKFELAHNGTLFLDEIGNLPPALQSKLLVVLQNRSFSPVGDNSHVPIDIRLICATNSDISTLVHQGIFREDLLYRINTIHIEIPPLRERLEDIDALATFFLNKYAKKYKRPNLNLSESVINKLKSYYWPGNIRELEHTIEKAVILCSSSKINPNDILFRPVKRQATRLPDTIEEMEKLMISGAIDKHGGNYSLAANQLGITRQTLYNKVKKYGI